MWVIHIAQWIFPGSLTHFGILPRTMTGLLQIPLSPFLHSNLMHLIGNSIPLLGLGILTQLKGRILFWEASVLIVVLGGLGTWLIGSASYHVGASGLVLGLWSFILTDAYLRKSFFAILIAVITVLLYGSLAFVILDVRPNISWAGHASGIVAGAIVAWFGVKSEQESKINNTE